MAIVGTAFVRLRVIGDKLAADIGKQVQSSVEKASPQLEDAGSNIGEKVGGKIGDGVQESAGSQLNKVADDIGTAIGERMAENMGKSLRRKVGDRLSSGLESARGGLNRAGDALQPIFDKIGQRWGSSTSGGFRKMLLGGLAAGIGVLITALPSILAFTGAIAGAVAASVVPAIAAIGPAATGAGLAAVAAFSAIKISAGLVGLAMKVPSAALEDFQKRAEKFRESIGRPVQEGLIPHLNASMRLLRPLISSIQPQLRELGLTLGDVASDFAEAVGQGVLMERIGRILTTNNTFVRDAGAGVGALGQAFIVLLDHLRPVTQVIGEMIGQFGEWALTTINAASASGQLDAFINRMWESFLRLTGTLVDFGVGLYNVFSASRPAADGMLATLEETGRKFREWTGDEENQTRMTNFFTKMRTISSEVYAILRDIAGTGLVALENTDVDSVIQGLGTLRTVSEGLGTIFRDIQEAAGPQLASAFSSFGDIIHELAESGVIGIVASAFATLLSSIAGLLALPGVGTLLSFVAGLAVLGKTVSFVVGIFSFFMTALRPVLGIFRLLMWAVGILVGAFGAIPVAIAAIIGGLIYFFAFTETGRAIISAVWEGIKSAISAAVDGIVAAFDWVVAQFQGVVTWFQSMAAMVGTIFQGIWNVITAIFSAIWSVVQTYLNLLWEIWSRIFTALMLPIRIFYGVVLLIWNAIYDFLAGVVSRIAAFVSGVWNGMVNGIRAALNIAWGFIMSIWNAIWGFIQPILQRIGNFVSGVWNGITDSIRGALDAAYGVVMRLWNNITDFIQGAMNRIRGIASGAWNALGDVGSGILAGLKTAANGVIGVINDVISGINTAIRLANELPGPDIPTIRPIPRLAQGGTVSPRGGGTLAMIAEAGRAERVEPLDPSGLSRRDRALIDSLTAGGATNVTVYIGERELTEIVDVVVEDRESGLADRVLTGTKG